MEVSGVPVMAGDDWVKKNTLSNQWTCDATQIHSVNHSNKPAKSSWSHNLWKDTMTSIQMLCPC